MTKDSKRNRFIFIFLLIVVAASSAAVLIWGRFVIRPREKLRHMQHSYNSIRPGMTVGEVIEVMGPPTNQNYSYDSQGRRVETVIYTIWALGSGERGFMIYLDSDNKVQDKAFIE